MFDLKRIREAPEAFDEGLTRRGLPPHADEICALDARHRAVQTELQELQARRNDASRQIGERKRQGEDAEDLMQEVGQIKSRLAEIEDEERRLQADIHALLSSLPNTPAVDVPEGQDESANVQVRAWGNKPTLDFEPRQHFEIGEALSQMDFERAAKLAGSRFVVLSRDLARMHRALAQFMLDLHATEHGYTEVIPPYLVRDEVLFGTGQLPKFGEDQFRTEEGYWLIPTAEVPLTNLVAQEILSENDLPMRFTAHTPCFRSEAGAAGKDTRGMLRQHQFDKVELVSIAHPDRSEDEHERMTNCAETVLQRLGLHYRVVVLSTGDMGFSARKTYDIEVWLPGQQLYREISSCSNCGDFQALRMKARFRPNGGKGTRPVHTLNGSGVAVGRALIAVMENYQRANGSIEVPEVLRGYMGGQEVIGGDA